MIRFVTLFVGLVTGPQLVEVSMSPPAVRAEIRLDGEVAAAVDEPPWKAAVDLGADLRPQRLEAVAYDAEGQVVGRDEQLVNVPRPRAEAVLTPETDADGRVTGARLLWSSPEFRRPRRVVFTLDGERIAHSGERVDLSGANPEKLHVLEATVEFPDDVTVREHLVFGTGAAGQTSYELTAVPVLRTGRQPLPEPDAMAGWFRARGEDVRVVDVERGEALVTVVRAPGAEPYLARLLERAGAVETVDRLGAPVRVIGTVAQQTDEGARLFPMSDSVDMDDRGLLAELETARFGALEFGLHRVADAVSVAGLRAAGGHGRRAVVLLLGDEREDGSRQSPAAVRRYLAELGVPLVVLDLGQRGAGEAWRPVVEVADPEDWMAAIRRLREDLAAQRLVWVTGRHLVRDVELGPNARDVDLAR